MSDDDDQDGLLGKRGIWMLLPYQNQEIVLDYKTWSQKKIVDSTFEELDKDGDGAIDFEGLKKLFLGFKNLNIFIGGSNKGSFQSVISLKRFFNYATIKNIKFNY